MRSKRVPSVALALIALAVLVKPGVAQTGCPQIEPYLSYASINGTPTTGTLGLPDQASINAGQCVTLRMVITKQSGSTITTTDVTTSPNTRFFTNPVHGSFSGPNGSIFCVSTADCNLEFPIYGVYHDPCSGTNQLDTAHIHINPCPPAVIAPTISCAGLSQDVCNETGLCGAHVTYGTPLVGGGVPPLKVDCVPASGSLFPVGTTTVTCTVTDAIGQTASCTFTVKVRDCEAPKITCPPSITVCASAGQCGATATIATIVTDNCGTAGVTVSCTAPLGPGGAPVPVTPTTVFPFGTTIVTCTATDAAGNTSTPCTTSITVFALAQTEISLSVSAINGVATTGNPDQVNIHVGDKITLKVLVTIAGCTSVFDATSFSTFFTSPPAPTFGTFAGNVFTAGPGSFNRQFPVYADFFNPCKGTFLRDTVHVTVK